ncbi:MAG: hypothetical protein IKF29_00420 [Oceanobacillus sp.]|nr:hypothetical protein [Oceanobacillus sp.]
MVESGNMYTCDICGKRVFISNRDLTLEGGLRKLGVHKVEISGMSSLYHMCHNCCKDLECYIGKKKESFKCTAKDEAICKEMTPDGHCNCSGYCPNKEVKE